MIRMQDQYAVHRFRLYRINLIVLTRNRKQHMQKILGIIQIVARVYKGLADGIFMGHRRDRRHLRDEAVRRNHPLARVLNIGGVVIKRRQGADYADHHGHRMGIAPKPPKQVLYTTFMLPTPNHLRLP